MNAMRPDFNIKISSGRLLFTGIAFMMTLIFTLSCRQEGGNDGMDESVFIFDTENVEGDASYYSRPAVITGHISNRKVYPNTTEISIVIPFYERISQKQTSVIYEDAFAFSFVPYAPRTISMPPYIDHLMVCPGDSIHVELDFADLTKAVFSGTGSDNNEKLNDFFVRYYLNDWPGVSNVDTDAEGNLVARYEYPDDFAEASKRQLDSHLERLDEFIAEQRPSPELAALCRKEIETDYYIALIQGLRVYKSFFGDEVSRYFKVQDAEALFNSDCLNSNLLELSSNIGVWLLRNLDQREVRRLAADYPSLVSLFKDSTDNGLLFQMMVSHFYNQLLEDNEIARFEEYFDSFNESVTYPLLKLSTRDRYVLKKAYQQNPRALSDAILNADRPRDGQDLDTKENEGLKLLRSIISKEEGKVVYVCVSATWCPGTQQELPYQQSLAADYKGKPLRIVNLYMDDDADDITSLALGIETYHLTDAQRLGLDPILHMGAGIPFYLLIDKDGVIVDFGGHLRPSHDATREKIDKYLE